MPIGNKMNRTIKPQTPLHMSKSKPHQIRASIIGTGYIADFHAHAIKSLQDVDLASVYDANLRSARTFASTWNVPRVAESFESLLKEQKPDCVHILTPPDQHHPIAKAALQAGVHVFLEKPMCTSVQEADELLALARDKGLHIGVNHNFLYTNAYQHLRKIASSGELGPIDYVAINHFFELKQLRFGPFDSWMLRLPGNVVLEIGPHLLSALLDLLGAPTDISVSADRGVQLPGGQHIFRRWRIHATVGRTAADISINLGPGFSQRNVCVHALYGSALVDFDANTCAIDRRTPLSIDLDRYKRSRLLARQLRSQARETLTDYILSRLKLRRRGNPYQSSIIDSVAAFYSGVRNNQPLEPPISGRLGRDVIDWCGKIIQAASVESVTSKPIPRSAIASRPTVLVLGGGGFIGRELIRQLVAAGYFVRAMVRRSGALLEEIDGSHLEIIHGDMRQEADLKSAMQGIQFVYHLATSEAKTWNDARRNEVESTRLVGEVCLAASVKRLVYTGTIASYYAGSRAGTISEETPLDRNIARRNYYARAKAASEVVLMDMHRERQLPVVIFRPGIVIGEGGNPFHWGVGMFTENNCEVWGNGKNSLPFVLVTDVASALVRGIEVQGIEGRSYNLIDIPLLTACDYLKELENRGAMKLSLRFRSFWRLYMFDLVKWVVKVAARHPDRVRVPSYFDWETRTQRAVFDCRRARAELGWAPASDRQRMIEEGIGGSLRSWLAACQ
jgi:predicted dehydrogenase/nucleoside-diphosphate-sugar epimerase